MAKVYFIMGCTACGKGAVGRELARRTGGQIVSVDSMKVYRRMDIGTGKASPEARAEIPHHCIDIVEPGESFSVAEYVRHADAAIEAIRSAGSIPLAVGGTSLYIKALSEGLFEGPPADPQIRAALKARADADGPAVLHQELTRIDPQAAARIHPNDEKRIIRALEVYRATGTAISELQKQWDAGRERFDCVFIGLRRDRDDQSGRINARVRRMVEAGLVEEVRGLLAEPTPLGPQAAQAVGYAELIEHFRGGGGLDKAIERIKINTRRLAKKQRTWQRRFRDVQWFDLAPDTSVESVVNRIMERIEIA